MTEKQLVLKNQKSSNSLTVNFIKGLWVPLLCFILVFVVIVLKFPYSQKQHFKYNFLYKAPAGLSEPATPELIARGNTLFHKNCAVCHGEKAVGQNPEKPFGYKDEAGIIHAPALSHRGHSYTHHVAALFFITKNGSMWRSDSAMQGWEGKLTDKEMVSIIHYVLSLWPKGIQKYSSRLLKHPAA